MSMPLPQGPNQHCGEVKPHAKHPNPSTLYATAWCDGVPELEPFVELTVRVPLQRWAGTADGRSHKEVLDFLEQYGLGLITGLIGKKDIAMVLRVRAEDMDKVYPVIPGTGGGLKAVVMPDEE